MEHTRTTHEQSVILKKIGYDVPDTHYWNAHLNLGWINEEGEECNYNKDYTWYYTRPKLVDVATWLREVKNWHVVVFQQNNDKWLCIPETLPRSFCNAMFDNKDTHDLALSAGVDFILKKLDSNA